MLLTLDVGNSAVKGGLFEGGEIAAVVRVDVAEPGNETAETWERALRDAVQAAVGEVDLERAGLASVVPGAVPAAVQALEAVTGSEVVVVSTEMPLPFRLDYDTPQTLGVDRLAAAAAAWVQFGRGAGDAGTGEAANRSVVAVDAGTAVNYEVVHRAGRYCGGAIAAGPALVQRALRSGTAQLPTVPLTFPDSPVGQSTRTAMQSGVMWGFVDGVQGMIDRLTATLPDTPALVLTGGWRDALSPRLDAEHTVVPHLVLEGVRVLME
jgi:type III pantothenate kinase